MNVNVCHLILVVMEGEGLGFLEVFERPRN